MDVFRNRSFVLLWVGQTTSRLGDSLCNIAGYWLLWEMTHSASIIGLAGAITSLATLAGLVSGIYVDRWNKIRTMIGSDLIRGALVLSIPLLTYLGYFHWSMIIAVFVLLGVLRQFFSPAQRSLLPEVVPSSRLPGAMSSLFVSEQLALMGGAFLAGSILIPLGISWAFVGNGLTFVVSLLCISSLKLPAETLKSAHSSEKKQSNFADFKETWQFIRRTPFLAVSTPLIAFLFFSFAPVMVLLSKWSDDVLHRGAFGYGAMEVSYSLGMAVGGFSAAFVYKKVSPRIGLSLSLFGTTLAISLFTWSQNLSLSVVALAMTGAFIAIANIILSTIQQQIVPSYIRGRFFATSQALITIALPLGYSLSGVAADSFGIVGVFAAISVCFLVGTLVILLSPGISKIHEPALEQGVEKTC